MKRFIDDYFFLWNGTKEELEQFIEHFNKAHPTIKVTAEFNFTTKSVNYLNTKIWVDETGMIKTDLYVKENKKNRIYYKVPNKIIHMPYGLLY